MVLENASTILKKMSHAAMRSGRNPADIILIAVTKTVATATIKEAIDAGLRIFGENRVQEALEKISNLKSQITPPSPPLNKGGTIGGLEWHLIGHLQKNKAKHAVQLFDLIHSLDSVELAEELNKQAEKIGKMQRVLVQVKLSEDETRHGISEDELIMLLKKIQRLKNLKLEGLMTMPPFFEDPEKARPYFKRLREIRDNMNSLRITHYALRELSMGMSHDFEVAIEEGATMVRIGAAIFGERSK